jgi:hypothetical protein
LQNFKAGVLVEIFVLSIRLRIALGNSGISHGSHFSHHA